ncbi:hypothetical protein HY468_02575 [Candidatus Roizmanbacteria bacterium]|nr:hypothetical protein [Candidatus Roizmanbacteria bacterium]
MAKHRTLAFWSIIFLIIAIPLTVYLAITRQFIFKGAVAGQVTVNLISATSQPNLLQEFTVEVHLNSGTLQVSGATVNVNYDPNLLMLTKVDPEVTAVTASAPFTDLVSPPNDMPFTLVAQKAANQLSTGSFKIATLTFLPVESGAGTIEVDPTGSSVVVNNGTSTDVTATAVKGTSVAHTVTQQLCRVEACTSSVVLQHQLRPDNATFNIDVSWSAVSTQTPAVYKVFHNIGSAVPADHPLQYLAGTTINSSFRDTRGGIGFQKQSTVYYDVDTYIACP